MYARHLVKSLRQPHADPLFVPPLPCKVQDSTPKVSQLAPNELVVALHDFDGWRADSRHGAQEADNRSGKAACLVVDYCIVHFNADENQVGRP